MPELGIVVGVSDAEKLEEALGEYRSVANKLLGKVKDWIPAAEIPDFEIPRPQTKREKGRTYAHYPVPEDWGLDEKFQPVGGLSSTVGVLSLSRKHAERLLDETPLKTDSSLLADPKKPLDSMFYVNWAEMMEMALPWVKYVRSLDGDDDDADKVGANDSEGSQSLASIPHLHIHHLPRKWRDDNSKRGHHSRY